MKKRAIQKVNVLSDKQVGKVLTYASLYVYIDFTVSRRGKVNHARHDYGRSGHLLVADSEMGYPY